MRDRNDGKPWSEKDEADLIACLKDGESIQQAAEFLCRSGTVLEVARKAQELLVIETEPMPKAR
jgi:hypothetical protein